MPPVAPLTATVLSASERVFFSIHFAALVPNVAAGDVGAVVTALLGLFGRQIPAAVAAGEMHNEGLLREASRLDAIGVVEEQLEEIGRDCDITEADDVEGRDPTSGLQL